jgi:hypothetical protein
MGSPLFYWNKLADCGVHGFGRFIIQTERL